MTDTASAAPSDAEIDAQWRESVEKHETTAAFVRDFARAVLAKWGAPTDVGEPVAWRIDWPDEPELGHYFSGAPTDSGRCQPLYTHPSPPEGMVMVPKEPTEAMKAAAVALLDKWEYSPPDEEV